VFSDKVAANGVRVLDELTVAEPKTKTFRNLVKALNVGPKVLFVVDKVPRNAALACRNLAGVELVGAADVNTYQLLLYPAVVVTKAGLEQIKTRLAEQKERTR